MLMDTRNVSVIPYFGDWSGKVIRGLQLIQISITAQLTNSFRSPNKHCRFPRDVVNGDKIPFIIQLENDCNATSFGKSLLHDVPP